MWSTQQLINIIYKVVNYNCHLTGNTYHRYYGWGVTL